MAKKKRHPDREDLEREFITLCEEAADRFLDRGDAGDILDLVRKLARLSGVAMAMDDLRAEVSALHAGTDEGSDEAE